MTASLELLIQTIVILYKQSIMMSVVRELKEKYLPSKKLILSRCITLLQTKYIIGNTNYKP